MPRYFDGVYPGELRRAKAAWQIPTPVVETTREVPCLRCGRDGGTVLRQYAGPGCSDEISSVCVRCATLQSSEGDHG